MQLRLVCAGIIVACGAGIGLRLAKKSAGRARLLRELIDALKLLSVRSARGGLPLAAALEESASGLLREIGAKMHKHGLNAEEALRKMNPDELGPEERGALEKLFSSLGAFGRAETLAELETCIAQLAIYESRALERAERAEKLYPPMGMLTALAIAVLLV